MVFEIKQSTEMKLIICLPLIISHHTCLCSVIAEGKQ